MYQGHEASTYYVLQTKQQVKINLLARIRTIFVHLTHAIEARLFSQIHRKNY